MALEKVPIQLDREKLPAAVEVLDKAFLNDPFVSRLFPNRAARPRQFSNTTMIALRYGLAYGEVQAVSPNLEGIAVWFPPGRTEPTAWDMMRFGMIFIPFSIGLRSTRMILAYADHTIKMRKRLLRGPHWYLQFLGVDPRYRGAGYGSFLLKSMLARLDREGVPCCLDTENEKNVPLYEHFGFRVLESSEIPGTGSHCWFMAREAGAIM
jgi:GNAT superfamily N-acetyltransferase